MDIFCKNNKKLIVGLIVAVAVVIVIAVFHGLSSSNKENPTPIPTITNSPTEVLSPTTKPVENPTPTVGGLPTKIPTPTIGVLPTNTPTPTPHIHNWEKRESRATCTEFSRTWEMCLCGTIQNEEFGTEYEHGALIYVVMTEPTEKSEGEYAEFCISCDELVHSGIIPRIGAIPTPTKAPTISPGHKHNYTETEIIPASCISLCYIYSVCECGDKKLTDTYPKTGHENVIYVEVKAPTESREGEYRMVCTLCGKITKTGKIPKIESPTKPNTIPTPRPNITLFPLPLETPNEDMSGMLVDEVTKIDEFVTKTTYKTGIIQTVYFDNNGRDIVTLSTKYPDGSSFYSNTEGKAWYKDAEGNSWSLIKHRVDDEHIFYTRNYQLVDGTTYHILCNSDSSLNQWSNVPCEKIMISRYANEKKTELFVSYEDKTAFFVFNKNGLSVYPDNYFNNDEESSISWDEYWDVVLKKSPEL